MTEPVPCPPSDDYTLAQQAQAVAADPDISAWVSANAGSGKTKVLIDRVARLLLEGAKPDSILCVTYTKAAANEMLARLFDRLGQWSIMEEPKLAKRLAELEGRDAASYDGARIRAARALFAQALETPGGLRIETIHAFCARVLRRFPLEAGVSPGFAEIEEDDARTLWQEAMEHAIMRADPQTLDRVSSEGGALGVVAGLSALKTNAAAIRAFARSCRNDPSAMTTSLRAMLGAPDETPRALLQRAMGDDLPRADLVAIANRLRGGAKTDAATAAALDVAVSDATDEDRWLAYRGIFATTKGWRTSNPYTAKYADPDIADLFQMKGDIGREAHRVMSADAAIRAAEMLERTMALLAVGLPALDHYESAKRRRGALDFDDLILHTRRLLSDDPTRTLWVLYKLDGGLKHVLLDEAQDTSPDQWALIDALTEEFFAGEGSQHQRTRTLFVVGDEKQSIYSFQGAAPEQFLRKRQTFIGRVPDGQSPEMEMSFRSSPEVLTFVDEVFRSDAFDGQAPFSIDPPSEADAPQHTARRANQPGSVEVWPIQERPEDAEADPWDAPVDSEGETSPKAALAKSIAQNLREMIERGDTVWRETPDRKWYRDAMRADDALILVRGRTGGLFEAIIRALKDEGLPVAGADRLVLADHIGVQDCLNLMRFALLPEDDLTLAEILRGPFCDLVDDDIHLFPLAHGRGSTSLWSRLKDQLGQPFGPAASFCDALLDMKDAPPFEFLSAVLETPLVAGRTGWTRLLERLGTPAREPVDALLARAIAHDSSGPSSLQTFVAAMDADGSQIKRDLSAPNGAVRVMTVHGAKGLQAPVVIVPDTTSAAAGAKDTLFVLDDGTPLWSPQKAGDIDRAAAAREDAGAKALREHRRLLYVALTRAQDRLVIAGAWHGQATGSGLGKNSWMGACLSAMERLGVEPDAERGVLRYGAQPPTARTVETRSETASDVPEWLTQPAPSEPDARRLVSPSQIGTRDAPVIPPLGPGAKPRLARGRAIHALLQVLPALPAGQRIAFARQRLSQDPDLDPSQHDEILNAAFGVLNDAEFADVFAPEGRAEAAIIGTAPELPDGVIVNGRVDRLVARDSDVLIIDFKTDRPAPADESGVAESYLVQMAAYQAVLRQAYPERDVRCALVWTDGPKLMPLTSDNLLAVLNKAATAL
ncbi:MAG: double-strand break repair helicase AddA [Pseudomonadota bacterium]